MFLILTGVQMKIPRSAAGGVSDYRYIVNYIPQQAAGQLDPKKIVCVCPCGSVAKKNDTTSGG